MFEMFSNEYLHRAHEERRRRLVRKVSKRRPEDSYRPGQKPADVVEMVFGPYRSQEDLIA